MIKTSTKTKAISEDPLENIATDLKTVESQFLDEQKQTKLFDNKLPYTVIDNMQKSCEPCCE